MGIINKVMLHFPSERCGEHQGDQTSSANHSWARWTKGLCSDPKLDEDQCF
ncbi:mCG147686 [Mus musculus]|nr:mCG147686 [Mus musculus]